MVSGVVICILLNYPLFLFLLNVPHIVHNVDRDSDFPLIGLLSDQKPRIKG